MRCTHFGLRLCLAAVLTTGATAARAASAATDATAASAATAAAQTVDAAESRVRASGPGAPISAAFVAQALQGVVGSNGASAIVLDAADGRVLGAAGDVQGERYAPGSALKPFVLLAALEGSVVQPQTVLPCRGTLMVGGRNVVCTHPRELRSFTAETALAYSCNEYFAAVAARMTPEALPRVLGAYGFRPSVGAAGLREPNARVLLALGLAGMRVTPAQMAVAYRRLALVLAAQKGRVAVDTVARGLEGSAAFGMASGAATAGVRLAGKTGTASEPGQAWTHGWFAGIVFDAGGKPRQIVVMLVPRGSGADAALLAHRFLVAERPR